MTATDESGRASGARAAAEVLARVDRAIDTRRDPVRARAMASYMRGQFPFAGVSAAQRSQIVREVVRAVPVLDEEALATLAEEAWARPEREHQYIAVRLLRRGVRRCGPGFLDVVERLVATKSWWDTVDELAAHIVGPLVAATPALRRRMDRWVQDSDVWLARAALLHQIRLGTHADADWLFGACLRRAGDRDVFVRKAIGWALREHARDDPDAVAAFVAHHRRRLAPLSTREALRGVHRWRS
jgi:3-methyladenine DNA glycosylase AlkD